MLGHHETAKGTKCHRSGVVAKFVLWLKVGIPSLSMDSVNRTKLGCFFVLFCLFVCFQKGAVDSYNMSKSHR